MITKRQLGIALVVGGVLAALGMFVADLLSLSVNSGVGPIQRSILIGAAVAVVLGLTLIPLGDKPA